MNIENYPIKFTIYNILLIILGLFINHRFPVIQIIGQEVYTIDVVFPIIILVAIAVAIRKYLLMKRK